MKLHFKYKLSQEIMDTLQLLVQYKRIDQFSYLSGELIIDVTSDNNEIDSNEEVTRFHLEKLGLKEVK